LSVTGISSLAVSHPLTTTPTATSPETFLQKYFKERRPEIQELQNALKSGDLTEARKAYNDLVALGHKLLHKDNPFLRADRALDFNAIGGALQRGDLDGARQAAAALQRTFEKPGTASAVAPTVSPDTVVHLSNSGA
jgi:hypothetical protein